MSRWFSVSIQGEARVSADEDPTDLLNSVLTSLEETEEDLEFDVEPDPATYDLRDGSTLWVYTLTARYSESFLSIEDAQAAAIELATKLELVVAEAASPIQTLKIVFLMQTVDSEDWDDPDAGKPPAMTANWEVDENGDLTSVRLEVGAALTAKVGNAAKQSDLEDRDFVYVAQVINELGGLDWWDLIRGAENAGDGLQAAIACADSEHAPRRSRSRISITGPIQIPTNRVAEAPFE